MIIYPAIDLRGGKVVRLVHGDPKQQTIFSDDPIATAQQWIDQGAEWIHVVNLDGAFNEQNDNLKVLADLAKLNAKIQFGGGMRALDDIAQALDLGASRVVMGTLAVQQPETVELAVKRFGAEAICLGLDARHGKITTHGWKEVTEITPIEFGKRMAKVGVVHALYTDVSRDGSLIGSNVIETIRLGRETGLKVIASGGVTSVNEIAQLAKSGVVAGVIIGMALYEGKLTLAEALHVS
ncbi:MAG: 1-(5-phosphoribosyl)-5-[(5-phosphoribosylamino) methylideneamino]imidazole-4-carboxamide isomerase [Phototrophicales bacterium]